MLGCQIDARQVTCEGSRLQILLVRWRIVIEMGASPVDQLSRLSGPLGTVCEAEEQQKSRPRFENQKTSPGRLQRHHTRSKRHVSSSHYEMAFVCYCAL